MELLKFARLQWDRFAAGGCVIAGFVLLLLGYLGTRDTEYVAAQVPYVISAGLTGVFFLGIGAVLWISADQRDEWRQLRTIALVIRQEQLDRRADANTAPAPATSPTWTEVTEAPTLTSVGLPRTVQR
ncbi:hypothetical protein [Sporichthya sp.]|uniref:hypothetical protein n=1 Tax=Sporichthya sp. TaxID=65475 RepID=UPI0017CA682D|nr:hypothetical protein [Sporichthya sp.]MBA3745174.1 hypothetical protein [Sporichthya sp.]